MPTDIRDLIEPHKAAIQQAGEGLLAGNIETVTKSLLGLAVGVATSSPTLGAFSSDVVASYGVLAQRTPTSWEPIVGPRP